MQKPRIELIETRKKAGLTQAQIAAKANLSRGHYANIEMGRHSPSVDVARSIAIVLNVAVDDIFLPIASVKQTAS